MNKRYYKCYKCGSVISVKDNQKPDVCCVPALHRTSGICGGGFDIEITRKEYRKLKASLILSFLNYGNGIPINRCYTDNL